MTRYSPWLLKILRALQEKQNAKRPKAKVRFTPFFSFNNNNNKNLPGLSLHRPHKFSLCVTSQFHCPRHSPHLSLNKTTELMNRIHIFPHLLLHLYICLSRITAFCTLRKRLAALELPKIELPQFAVFFFF